MAVPQVQQAWVYREIGAAKDVLKLESISVPQLSSPSQVLVQVKSAALNPIDGKRRQGYLGDANSPLPIVPGYDCAGVVVKVGNEATSKFQVGEEVYGMATPSPIMHPAQYGTLAHYVACEESYLASKPKHLSFLDAGSLPLAILTATQALQKAGCAPGSSVLVTGGSGGVGSLAIQVAKQVFKAAHVATTGSASKTEFLKGLGADEVIDYHSVDYTQRPERYDVVCDCVGDVSKGVQVLKDGGALVSILTRDPAYRYVVQPKGEDLEMLNPYIESGAVKAVVDPNGQFAFSQVVEAFEYLETGRATGKVVVSPIG